MDSGYVHDAYMILGSDTQRVDLSSPTTLSVLTVLLIFGMKQESIDVVLLLMDNLLVSFEGAGLLEFGNYLPNWESRGKWGKMGGNGRMLAFCGKMGRTVCKGWRHFLGQPHIFPTNRGAGILGNRISCLKPPQTQI